MVAGAGVLGGDAIPGDVGALEAMVARLRRSVDQIDSIHGRVSSNGLGGSWSGAAAAAFHASLQQLPGELQQVSVPLTVAADALHALAGAVSDHQSRATWLATQITGAEDDLARAQARRASAQAQLTSAHRAASAAADPVSHTAALHAVSRAATAAAVAQAGHADATAHLGSLRAAASANHAEWQQAAAVCAGRLDAASHHGIRSTLGRWFERNVEDRVNAAGIFFERLGREARGRPRSLARALLHGSMRERIGNVIKYEEAKGVRAAHAAWNSAWKKAGRLEHLKPPWKSIQKASGHLGKALGMVVPIYEGAKEIRAHHYGQAFGTIAAGVVTAPLKLGTAVLDTATGGSITGYTQIAFEAPFDAFSQSGRDQFTQRVETGQYGPLPKWEADYVSKPLGNFIYDHILN